MENGMRAWLYARLSRDDDKELNSLTNQQHILREYASKNNFKIVGESFDDNVSGMHFNREGIEEISNAVEEKLIDAVIVKDLSRLGRHRAQTAMFIDFLRENEVRVLSVTENIDTSNEDDDLMIGFKGVVNDMYARDAAKKIRAGYLQKQKDGIVLIPPFGYFKDKNTGNVEIVEETSQIVKKIFEMYVAGYGIKAIATQLNKEGIKTPGYYQKKIIGKNLRNNVPEMSHRYLWEHTAVKRILQNEFYTGTLVCHKSYTSKINKIRKLLPPEESFRHENAVPAIISKEIWDQAQFLLEHKNKNNVRAAQYSACHRYAGLIECGNCGCTCICKIRRWRNKPPRFEYICNGYNRYGKENCTPHRIGEEELDEIIYKEILEIKKMAHENFERVNKNLKKWTAEKPSVKIQIQKFEEMLEQRKLDQQSILLERIRDKSRADIYTQMLEVCEKDIKDLDKKIKDFGDLEKTIKKRKNEMQTAVDFIDAIVEDGAISDTHLRMLIEKIIIFESNDGKLDVKIILNGDFRNHFDTYDEDGNIVGRVSECWNFSDVNSIGKEIADNIEIKTDEKCEAKYRVK